MKIAVVGAGLAGLSLSLTFARMPGAEVTVFDAEPASRRASGISTGLLHPFVGRNALRSWRSDEGMRATLELVEQVETLLNYPVASRSGILRLAMNERQAKDFYKRSKVDPEAVWLDVDQLKEKLPDAPPLPGLWIPSGMTFYSTRYLEGLAQLAQSSGATFSNQEIHTLRELESFDCIVLAAGHRIKAFPECASLCLEPTKGHALICRSKKALPPFSLLGSGHISLMEDPELCQIGSTYEHNFRSLEPDPAVAAELLAKAAQFYPPAAEFESLELRASARISPMQGYRPIAEQIGPKLWVFTGLGSRGLLYHALLGNELALAIALQLNLLQQID